MLSGAVKVEVALLAAVLGSSPGPAVPLAATLRVALEPEEVPFYRGEALVLQERRVEAIEQTRSAVELQPKDTRPQLRYGEIRFSEWQDAEAERGYRAALELEPDNSPGTGSATLTSARSGSTRRSTRS
jgi:hypothetical protein